MVSLPCSLENDDHCPGSEMASVLCGCDRHTVTSKDLITVYKRV